MNLQEQIILLFLGSVLTALGTSYLYVRQARTELRKEFQSRFNEKKWEIYTKFTNLLPILNEIDKLGNQGYLDELSNAGERKLEKLRDIYYEEVEKIESEILIIGSTDVVNSFLVWKAYTSENSPKGELVVKKLIELVNLMRKDLGLENSDLSVNDFDGLYFYSSKFLRRLLRDAKAGRREAEIDIDRREEE